MGRGGSGRGKGRRGQASAQPKGGLSELPETQSGTPPGPETLQQLLDFPDIIYSRLFSADLGPGAADRLHRLQVVLRKGIDLSSQYSGKGTAETAAGHLSQKFAEERVLGNDGDTDNPWLQVVSAFDLKQFAVDILRSHEGSSQPQCIFGDMACCLSSSARAELDRLMPAKSQSPQERARAYTEMDSYLREHLQEAFPSDCSAPCFKHASQSGCRVWPQKTRTDSLRLWVAGQTCKDVSRRGSRQGFAGPHTKAYVIWLGMVRKQQPDLFIHEITTSSEAESRLRKDLGDLYDIHTNDGLSPDQIGVPVHRRRQFSIGILKGKWIYLGSWDEFYSLMRSSCVLSGDVFFRPTADEHRIEIGKQLAKRHGWVVDEGLPVPLEDQLTPAEMRRYREYQGRARAMKLPADQFYCFDVEQDLPFGNISTQGPCLISRGKIIHGQKALLATGLEHLLIMGALIAG